MKQDSKNYKVRCVGYRYRKGERYFTIGKVYDVVNGEITNDNGYTYKNWDDVIKFLSGWYRFERVDNGSVVSRVIFNNPATIILWADGTKTIAKTHGDDAFDHEKGFAVACAKKLLGNGDAFRREFAKWTPVDKEPNIDGFKVGDRVVYDHHIGTVIALSESGKIGVEFDKPDIGSHNCGGVTLVAGHNGASGMCKWFTSGNIRHFQDRRLTTEELTTEELLSMQGVKVWVVPLDENGKPGALEDVVRLGGWHTIKNDRIYDEHGEFYRIKDENTPYGFWAYLEPPKK